LTIFNESASGVLRILHWVRGPASKNSISHRLSCNFSIFVTFLYFESFGFSQLYLNLCISRFVSCIFEDECFATSRTRNVFNVYHST
jgi:hypothetical protein